MKYFVAVKHFENEIVLLLIGAMHYYEQYIKTWSLTHLLPHVSTAWI